MVRFLDTVTWRVLFQALHTMPSQHEAVQNAAPFMRTYKKRTMMSDDGTCLGCVTHYSYFFT
jgi:hypothetical protein